MQVKKQQLEPDMKQWIGSKFEMDWFKIWEGVYQGCILSPYLFNLYAGYIMWKAGLDDPQVGIKIAGRNIDNLRYADEITLISESE